ncbi:MAG: class I SAM-dependent methyltransferase [Rubrivivax sp.]
MTPDSPQDPNEALADRYARRGATDRYHPLQPDVWQTLQERQRAMLGLFAQAGWTDLSTRCITELGCGSGGNLLELLRLGCSPELLTGLELLPQRHAQARRLLPAATTVWLGDALHAPVPPQSQDLVLVSTVFSSLLDDGQQQAMAQTMWRWLKPDGAVLWYDFEVDNPRNADVRGVPLRRLRELFPGAPINHRRVTLAPPLARVLCRWHPALYGVFNSVPLLRTHRLAWICKPT